MSLKKVRQEKGKWKEDFKFGANFLRMFFGGLSYFAAENLPPKKEHFFRMSIQENVHESLSENFPRKMIRYLIS
jgi:hypothetical protein